MMKKLFLLTVIILVCLFGRIERSSAFELLDRLLGMNASPTQKCDVCQKGAHQKTPHQKAKKPHQKTPHQKAKTPRHKTQKGAAQKGSKSHRVNEAGPIGERSDNQQGYDFPVPPPPPTPRD
jgi:hypothetical protein